MAKALGALLRESGVHITAVAGRNPDSTTAAAQFIGATKAITLPDLPKHATHILIAVSDDAIASVAEELRHAGFCDGVALHTSGAAGPEALEPLSANNNSIGVLHPLQTVPSPERGIQALRGSTFAYSGDERAIQWARTLIRHLEGKALAVDSRRWSNYHAAAVMACNYQVTLVDAALELMEKAGLKREQALDALAPILRTTIDNILSSKPEMALTGPIRRGDVATIEKHLNALDDALPETKELYIAAARRTIPFAGPAAAKIADVFDEEVSRS